MTPVPEPPEAEPPTARGSPTPEPPAGSLPRGAPPEEAAPGEPRGMGIARAAGVISFATFLSRVLGLVREQVFAVFFGAGLAVDAFQVAFRIPNLLRDLFAEGAMSAAFVPTLTGTRERQGDEAAFRLANLVINFLLVVTAAICLVGILGAKWFVPLLAPGFGRVPGKLELTTLMTQIMMPFLLLVALAAAVMGVLNTRRIFFLPAVAPTMLNLSLIAAGFVIAPFMPRFGLEPIVGMAVGATLGGLGQLLIQVPALHGLGFRWRPILSFRDPGVIRMVTLMAPAAVGLAATQVNIFVNTLLASLLVQGSVSWLNYAYRLMQLPIGLFGVAIATVTLAEVSRHAARKDMAELKRTVAFSLRFVFFLTLPATVFLVVLAEPIVALLYQHGRFGAADTVQTAQALWAYAVGLAAFSAVRVLVPVCYSLGMTRLPVTISFITITANVILNFALMGPLQHRGLALATSIASVLNFALLFELLRRKVGGLGGGGIARAGFKILLASGVAGAAGYFAAAGAAHGLPDGGLLARAAVVGIGFLAGLLTYLAACVVLRIEEAAPAFLAAARVLGARPRPPGR